MLHSDLYHILTIAIYPYNIGFLWHGASYWYVNLLSYKQGVTGSSPVSPTSSKHRGFSDWLTPWKAPETPWFTTYSLPITRTTTFDTLKPHLRIKRNKRIKYRKRPGLPPGLRNKRIKRNKSYCRQDAKRLPIFSVASCFILSVTPL